MDQEDFNNGRQTDKQNAHYEKKLFQEVTRFNKKAPNSFVKAKVCKIYNKYDEDRFDGVNNV